MLCRHESRSCQPLPSSQKNKTTHPTLPPALKNTTRKLEPQLTFTAYYWIHELEITRYAKQVPDFITPIHQCLVEKIFKMKTSRKIVEISDQIPDGQDEVYGRLRTDVIDALHKELDDIGKQNLNAWIVQFCGEKQPILIDR